MSATPFMHQEISIQINVSLVVAHGSQLVLNIYIKYAITCVNILIYGTIC